MHHPLRTADVSAHIFFRLRALSTSTHARNNKGDTQIAVKLIYVRNHNKRNIKVRVGTPGASSRRRSAWCTWQSACRTHRTIFVLALRCLVSCSVCDSNSDNMNTKLCLTANVAEWERCLFVSLVSKCSECVTNAHTCKFNHNTHGYANKRCSSTPMFAFKSAIKRPRLHDAEEIDPASVLQKLSLNACIG